MNDLRFAVRQLLKNPGFTIVTVLTLALCIGANTAIFSFVNAILLKPLPYPRPHELVQLFENNVANGWHNLTVRTRLSPEELSRAIRAQLDEMDKDLPLENIRTLSWMMDSALAGRRLSVQLVAGFAGMALLLTAIGIYGVMAYNVGQRSREIGIRMALGARQKDVLALVLSEGMSCLGIGMIAGLAGAFGLTRLLRSLLFGVTATDPLTYILVPVILAAVALAACLIPASRATQVDPVVA